MFTGKTLVALDLETTGLRPHADRIVEIGAVKFCDGEVVDTYSQLVHPGIKVTALSEAITGITNDELADAPSFSEVQNEIREFIGDAIIVGHNVQFDINFLKANGVDCTDNVVFDTYELSLTVIPDQPSYSLSSLAENIGIEQPVAHRALHDAIASLDLLRYICSEVESLPRDIIQALIAEIEKSDWAAGEIFREALAGAKPARTSRKASSVQYVDTETPEPTIEWDVQSAMKFFSTGGALQKRMPEYAERAEQQEMVSEVADALSDHTSVVVEAGTGTGKTLAYAIPLALRTLSTGERGVIATYTLTLQDQLRDKEIPLIQQLVADEFDAELRVAYMKGRSHYFCRNRFELMRSKDVLAPEEVRFVIRILLWQYRHANDADYVFEKSDVAIGHGEYQLWDAVASDVDFCRGAQCTEESGCTVQRMRRKAREAHLIITNHAFLAADAAHDNRLVPEYSYLVVDEAHHLEDVVTNRFTSQIRSKSWDRFCSDIAFALKKADDTDDALDIVENLRQRGPIFFGFVGLLTTHLVPDANTDYQVQARIDDDAREHWYWHNVDQSGEVLLSSLRDLEHTISDLADTYPDEMRYRMVQSTLQRYLTVLERLLVPNEEIVWTTVYSDGNSCVSTAPLRVDAVIKNSLYAGRKSVILTSATLQANESFDYFAHTHGVDDTWKKLATPAPFDYARQSQIVLPEQFPNPVSPKYPKAVEQMCTEIVEALQGRTLILTTSYREVERLYAGLTIAFRGTDVAVLAQRLSGKPDKLIAAFKESSQSVLIGTSSFWEGIDVPGEQLSCVIVPRLPFEVPSDPIYQARCGLFEDPFMECALPRAVITFRQGFGRLIRAHDDRGVIVILDSRLTQKSYGRVFIDSLPQMPVHSVARDKAIDTITDFLS